MGINRREKIFLVGRSRTDFFIEEVLAWEIDL